MVEGGTSFGESVKGGGGGGGGADVSGKVYLVHKIILTFFPTVH